VCLLRRGGVEVGRREATLGEGDAQGCEELAVSGAAEPVDPETRLQRLRNLERLTVVLDDEPEGGRVGITGLRDGMVAVLFEEGALGQGAEPVILGEQRATARAAVAERAIGRWPGCGRAGPPPSGRGCRRDQAQLVCRVQDDPVEEP
jgi:hypothetical protein